MLQSKITVIVTSYNYAQFIIDALESVSKQTFHDFECIILDDGSIDNTKEIVTKWIKKDNRFKYFYQENTGVSKARNNAIKKASSEYILPLDADDKIGENYLEECFNAIRFNREVKIVYGQSYLLNNPYKKFNLDNYNFEDLLYKNMLHCTSLFRKKDWERIGGFDEKLTVGLEDWEFWIHLLKGGGKVVKISKCKFYYRIKEQSLNVTMISDSYGYDSRLYIFNKHIESYRKTNFYDMYFENYRLKKKVKNPLLFLSSTKLVVLFVKSVIESVKSIAVRVKWKIIKLLYK